MNSNIKILFDEASKYDPTIIYDHKFHDLLTKKKIKSAVTSPSTIFKNMMSGEITLSTNFPPPLINKSYQDKDELIKRIAESESDYKHRIKVGYKKPSVRLSLSDVMYLWRYPSARVHVTDLHLNRTDVADTFDQNGLGSFNLFRFGTETVSDLEMMTLIVSTLGTVTDSHSDDADGANHCFVGKKLWIAWDTYEGLAAGLEDGEREKLTSPPKFDMSSFLSLDTSCWFVLDEGKTLFLPGNFTHKVITLENYIGLSNFNFSFANAIRTLSRWMQHEPLFCKRSDQQTAEKVISELIQITLNKFEKLQSASLNQKRKWGFDYFEQALDAFQKENSLSDFLQMFSDNDRDSLNRLLDSRVVSSSF